MAKCDHIFLVKKGLHVGGQANLLLKPRLLFGVVQHRMSVGEMFTSLRITVALTDSKVIAIKEWLLLSISSLTVGHVSSLLHQCSSKHLSG